MNYRDKIFFDSDISLKGVQNRKIGVIGYGNQGRAQALNLKDSGLDVCVGLRRKSLSKNSVKNDGLRIINISSLIKECDIVAIMIPDLEIISFFKKYLKMFSKNQTILLSHGYALVYGDFDVPKDINIAMVAPSGGGGVVRSEYQKGFGVPALVASYRNSSKESLQVAMSYAKAIGCSKAAVFLSTFKEEVETDLFGEQVLLTGSIPMLIINSYKVLLEEGYSPIVSWFVCFYELRTIVDLMFQQGLNSFYDMISTTAKYGGLNAGKCLIDEDFVSRIRKVLKNIKSGDFNKEFKKSLHGKTNVDSIQKELLSSKELNQIETLILKKFNS
ncbi:MAG: ketol-acid reductoisomerase [Pelagibacteraceae bacterium TMED124]|nr:ketol-acid reductoisomerase [Candidatus Neomarinimicrobiota bacterium]RPG18596.1 MAG: ketol-acid reductoisomerase [Pelagibacteraceae bacterium TMED124]